MAGGISPRWLLIGNSRWHWAEQDDLGLRFWGESPWRDNAGEPSSEDFHSRRELSDPAPLAWAAVGGVPPDAGLNPATRMHLEHVPLAEAPSWLGIDRALAGWEAWRQTGGPVLVVDAGTVLSLTRVDGEGRFQGGRLMAGLALQLRAMASGTTALPVIEASEQIGAGVVSGWPIDTRQAMATGVTLGLAAAVTAAALEVVAEDPACQILLTGGDAPSLLDRICPRGGAADLPLLHRPDLVMEALVGLRPSIWQSSNSGQSFMQRIPG